MQTPYMQQCRKRSPKKPKLLLIAIVATKALYIQWDTSKITLSLAPNLAAHSGTLGIDGWFVCLLVLVQAVQCWR